MTAKYETLNLGTGQLVVIDLSSATPQGRPIGILKDAKLTKAYTMKELRDGTKQISIDNAQTAKKITLSGKLGSSYANLLATLSPGAVVSTGGESLYTETVAIGATVTPTKTLLNVLYVLSPAGLPMVQVATGATLATGQFKISAGAFAFYSTDVSGGGNVTLVYTWNDNTLTTVAEAQATIGAQNPVGLFLSSTYTDAAGTAHRMAIRAYAAKPSKLDISFKAEDYTEYDTEFDCVVDSNNKCIDTIVIR
jgi:hypothetical protein